MSDYDFLPASDGTGDVGLMHVEATRLTGDATIVVDSAVNVPAKFIGSYGDLLPSNYLDPSTKQAFKGHLSGGNLIIDAFEPGSSDTGNVEGQVVVIKPETGWANRVASFLKNMTGVGTPEAVTTANITAAAITATSVTTPALTVSSTVNVPDGSIQPAKLASHIVMGDLGITTTGNKVIAGLPFKPSLVMFTPYWPIGVSTTANVSFGNGVIDADGNMFSAWGIARIGNGGVAGKSTANCMIIQSISSGGGSATTELAATFVSMNSDGFTINVGTFGGAPRGGHYIAFA